MNIRAEDLRESLIVLRSVACDRTGWSRLFASAPMEAFDVEVEIRKLHAELREKEDKIARIQAAARRLCDKIGLDYDAV